MVKIERKGGIKREIGRGYEDKREKEREKERERKGGREGTVDREIDGEREKYEEG